MSATYPRVMDSTFVPRWGKLAAQHPKQAHHYACSVCGAVATHKVFVQVSWFRGDDEGPFKACREHKTAAQELLDRAASQQITEGKK
jgi:hypothetical protein